MRERRSLWRAALLGGALAATLLLFGLPGTSPAASPAVVLPHDIEAALGQMDSLGRFFGAFAARDTNGFAQERWRRLSLGYPGTAEILRGLIAGGDLAIDDLPEGRVSAILDRGEIVIDRDLDGRWLTGPVPFDPDRVAAERRDLLLPALIEGLARRQPPQDWPWLADHLRAVGGFGALAQDPVARPLLARFFHAKDAYLWLALQRIGEGEPTVRRALAARQSAAFEVVRRLATDLAATFGTAPADRLRRDWADYVAQVDGFAVTRGWLLLDPALSRTQLGDAARREADAVNEAAAAMVATAPRSAVAAARQALASAAPRQLEEPPRRAAAPVTLERVVAEAVPPELEALAAELPLQALAFRPEAAVRMDAAAFGAFAARVKEAAAQPDPRLALAEREAQLGAARSELATLESKVAALAAAAEAGAAEAQRLQAALEAERVRRAGMERQLAAQEAAEAQRLQAALEAERVRRAEAEAELAATAAAEADRAAAPASAPKPLPQIAVVSPRPVAEQPAAAPAAVNPHVLYAVAAAAVILLLAVLLWARGRRGAAVAGPPPLLLTAPASDALHVTLQPPEPVSQPTPSAGRPARQPGVPVRVNGVAPPTAAARAAMKAGSARHAARSPEPAREADTAAHPIVQALRQGNLPLFELLFGELTDLRAPQLQRIVYGGRGEDLAIVCRAVGVDKLLFGSIYMLTDHLRSGDAEEEAARTTEILRLYDRMPPATARKVLAKWQRDWHARAEAEPSADV